MGTADSGYSLWIYFGTGRYLSVLDEADASQNRIYAVKDPYYNSKLDPGELSAQLALEPFTEPLLYDATPVKVYTDGTITATRVQDHVDPYSPPGAPGDDLYLLSSSLMSSATDQVWIDGIATATAGYTGVPEGGLQEGNVSGGITSSLGSITGAAPCWQCAPQPETVNDFHSTKKQGPTDYGSTRATFTKGTR